MRSHFTEQILRNVFCGSFGFVNCILLTGNVRVVVWNISTVVWELSPDKSIIFALAAAKIMPILTHLMTAINKSLHPGSQASEETIMGN